MPNNFSRSNVNEQMLQVSMPDMSSFNMSHTATITPRMGEITPFNFEPLLPRAVINATNKPKLDLEKVLTPSIGRIRMDTHNFVVLAHRINRDWKFFKEVKAGYESLPVFYPYRLMSQVFAFLLNGGDLHVIGGPITPNTLVGDIQFRDMTNSSINQKFVLTQVFDKSKSPSSYQLFLRLLYWSVTDKYQKLIEYNSTSRGIGYFMDFLLQECTRMRQKFEYYSNTDSPVVLPNFADVILDILQPYFGEGSIMEQLGYPIFNKYSMLYENIYHLFEPFNASVLPSGSVYSDNAIGYLSSLSLSSLFNISGYDGENDELTFFTDKPKSEMALRAYYAVWFDYFRNFHVEKRADILDPDTFDNNSIVGAATVLFGAEDVVINNRFLTLCAMLLPHKRNYARDYVTTVQVDDAYRYVYVPWLPSADGSANATTDETDKFYDNVSSLIVDNKYINFPSSDPNSPNSATPYSTLMADLQTMRRSKMLERVLAREYYYPDTYAGRMLAHYGIKPGDIDTMNSVYLSGSEQFISGDQLKANIGTSDTPQGTRTFIGGASSVDSYSYAAQDFAYLISTLSLVPMVSYDATNPHHDEFHVTDIPLPQYAADTRCLIRPNDLIRGFEGQVTPLGYVPRYYPYRVHPDETHGKYLTDYRSYNFMRDWFNMTSVSFSSVTSITRNPIDYLMRKDLSLNPYFLRVNVPLDAFMNINSYDSVAFGKVDIECFITNPLPAAIEFI